MTHRRRQQTENDERRATASRPSGVGPALLPGHAATDRHPTAGERQAKEIPEPGMPTVIRERLPRLSVAPRPPMLVLIPLLLRLSRTPGTILIDFLNRQPMAAPLPRP